MADVCTISGSITSADGSPMSGACISAQAIVPQTVQGSQQSDKVVTTNTDANGDFSIDLVRQATVQFTITDGATKTVLLDRQLVVPDQATEDLENWI